MAKSKPPTPFAARLKAAREKLGITQKDAADRIRYTLSSYSKMEQGRRTPPKLRQDLIVSLLKRG